MNEMELLTRMRDEVPLAAVSPRAEQAFFTGLREPAAPARGARLVGPARRIRPRWRAALAAGLGLALAAGAAAGIATQSTPAPGAPQPTLAVRLLAAEAARAAAAGPSVSPHQWLYNKVLSVRIINGQTQANVGWTTADNLQWAFYSGGKLLRAPWPIGGIAPYGRWPDGQPDLGALAVRYSALDRLPREPGALLNSLRRITSRNAAPGAWKRIVFQQIGDMFTYYVMPPAVTAALYRAIALIPGVRAHRNAVDLAGQHGTGFVLYVDSIANEIILSPHSYRFMGVQYSQPHTPPDGVAIVSRAFVSGPGVRP